MASTPTSGTQKQIERVGDSAHEAIDRAAQTASRRTPRNGWR